MTRLEAEAQRYMAEHPFTMAGFSRAEAELIQGAYREAFVAGAEWAFERAAQILDEAQVGLAGLALGARTESQQERFESAQTALTEAANTVRTLATEEDAP